MLDEIHIKLQKAKEDLYYKQKWEKHISELQHIKQQMQINSSNLQKQIVKEQKDVERLEKITITNILASLTGTKYEKLDKEKQEAAAAQLKYESKLQEIKTIENEITELSQRLKQVENAENQYNVLLNEKENLLIQNNPVTANKLNEIDRELGDTTIQLIEIDEALQNGKHAYEKIEDAISHLKEAEDWSTLDMFGGGALSTAIKHSSLDKAEGSIYESQSSLRKFKLELEDVQVNFDHQIKLDGFLTFSDYFFDNIFVDWSIHGEIEESLQRVTQTQKRVADLLSMLSDKERELSDQISELKDQRLQIIEKSEY